MRVRSVSKGRVGVCMLLCFSQIRDCAKKTKDLSATERDDREDGEGRDVYATLIQSDTVQSYGRAKTDTSPGRVHLCKNKKDLSASEIEDRSHGEGGGVYATLLQSDTVQ